MDESYQHPNSCTDEQESMSENILIVYLQIQRLDTHAEKQERRRSAAHRCSLAPGISQQYTSNQHFAHFCKSEISCK